MIHPGSFPSGRLVGCVVCMLVVYWGGSVVAAPPPRALLRAAAEVGAAPGSAAAWLQLSEEALALAVAKADLAWAEAAYTAASRTLEIDPNHYDGWLQLARVDIHLGRFEDALPLCSEALTVQPHEALAWALMGDAFTRSGKYRGADSCYYEMYELDQGFHSLIRVGRREFEFEDYEKAIEYMSLAILAAENGEVGKNELASAHAELAGMLFLHGEVATAESHVEQALAIDREQLDAMAFEAEIRGFQGDVRGASERCNKLVALSPHPRYIASLARWVARSGDATRARQLVHMAEQSYKTLSRKFPEAVNPERIEFMIAWKTDPPATLALAYRESRRVRDVHTYERLAAAYYENEKYDLAWSSIALALRKGAKHPRTLYRAAMIAKAMGNEEKFAEFAAKARAANPQIEKLYGAFEE